MFFREDIPLSIVWPSVRPCVPWSHNARQRLPPREISFMFSCFIYCQVLPCAPTMVSCKFQSDLNHVSPSAVVPKCFSTHESTLKSIVFVRPWAGVVFQRSLLLFSRAWSWPIPNKVFFREPSENTLLDLLAPSMSSVDKNRCSLIIEGNSWPSWTLIAAVSSCITCGPNIAFSSSAVVGVCLLWAGKGYGVISACLVEFSAIFLFWNRHYLALWLQRNSQEQGSVFNEIHGREVNIWSCPCVCCCCCCCCSRPAISCFEV